MASTTFEYALRSGGTALALTSLALALACAGGEVNDGTTTFGSETAGDGDGDTTGDGDGDTSGDGDGDTSGDGDGDTGSCTSIGCECDGTPGSCDPDLNCVEGVCQSVTCGNGVAETPAEDCDDGNDFEGDGCDNDCSFTMLLDVSAGNAHTCALIEGGRVRCWGLNSSGELGYGNIDNIGDNEVPSAPGDVVLGAKALSLSAGGSHTCVYLEDETVRCWGRNEFGQLGQGNTNNVGDDEFPFSVNPVNINSDVLQVVAGGNHSCALVGAGNVRCWGLNASGQLGYGNNTNLAVPLTVDLTLGALAVDLSAGTDHNCALLEDGKVRCWGRNNNGQLGYGNTENIGDTETPGSVVPVPILPQGILDGTAVTDIALGDGHSCVLFETGDLLCWGNNFYGQLGQGSTTTVGDNETLATLFPIDLGGDAAGVSLGKHHTCALLAGGQLKCWGRNGYGQLGYGNLEHIGDDEKPSTVEPIELGGGSVTAFSAGAYHSCAILDDHDLRCWGFNDFGQLGYGDTQTRGINEVPAELGAVPLL